MALLLVDLAKDSVGHQVHGLADAGQRRAYLVGEHGDEVLAHALLLLQPPGHAVEGLGQVAQLVLGGHVDRAGGLAPAQFADAPAYLGQ